jgi:hypothetical protein
VGTRRRPRPFPCRPVDEGRRRRRVCSGVVYYSPPPGTTCAALRSNRRPDPAMTSITSSRQRIPRGALSARGLTHLVDCPRGGRRTPRRRPRTGDRAVGASHPFALFCRSHLLLLLLLLLIHGHPLPPSRPTDDDEMDHHVAWEAAVLRGDRGCVGRFRPFFPLSCSRRSGPEGGWYLGRAAGAGRGT